MSEEIELILKTKEFIDRFLLDIHTIVDCGAADGNESIEFRELFPFPNVLMFEPNPEKTEKLSAISKSRGIRFYPFGVYSSNCNKEYYQDNLNSSLYRHKVDQDNPKSLIRCVKLSDYDTPDWLWLDIQGAELDALLGLEEKIEDVKIITIEMCIEQLYFDIPLYDEINDFLTRNNFERVFGPSPEEGGSGFDNYIYINKRFKPC